MHPQKEENEGVGGAERSDKTEMHPQKEENEENGGAE